MISKSKKITFAILTAICFLLAGIVLFIGFGVTELTRSHYNESNTYEYEATFVKKETNENIFQIYVQEYGCYLTFECNALADEQNLENLTAGDKLSFRSQSKIESVEANEHFDWLSIVSLSSEGNDIVTFESSEFAEAKSILTVKIACTVFAVLFISGAVVLILYCVGVLPKKT